MNQIRFVQIQHPVGQGGFHTGHLLHPRAVRQGGLHASNRFNPHFSMRAPPSFSWGYDCGSNQSSALAAQINRVSGIPLDVLFISHLDGDHVSGVDKLLRATSGVREVVLPYLNDKDWALHLAASAAAGTLTGNLVDLVADPGSWFGARGVSRITYVEAGDDDAGGGPDPIGSLEPALDGNDHGIDLAENIQQPMEAVWSRSPIAIHPGDKSGARAESVSVTRGAVATVVAANRTVNWVLSPFTFRPPAAMMLAFRTMLDSIFGAGLTAGQYAAKAGTDVGRDDLKKCYEAVWKSQNLHSLALYAGPAIPTVQTERKLRTTAWHGGFVRRLIQPGWLSTGDFNTSVKKRRDALLGYYSRYAAMVGQLGLPHHGADASFDAEILAAFPDLGCAIAAVGANGYGHPGAGVKAAVAATSSVDFVVVDEYASSLYRVSGPVHF